MKFGSVSTHKSVPMKSSVLMEGSAVESMKSRSILMQESAVE
jgi:hypothetical protein